MRACPLETESTRSKPFEDQANYSRYHHKKCTKIYKNLKFKTTHQIYLILNVKNGNDNKALRWVIMARLLLITCWLRDGMDSCMLRC